MSRTDKDKPDWVRSVDYGFEPYHWCREHHSRSWQKLDYNCDLPATPPPLNYDEYGNWRLSKKTRCHWVACSPPDGHSQLRGFRKKFWRHSEFFGPQRTNERMAAREVIKGNHEVEFPDGRHRHSVHWDLS